MWHFAQIMSLQHILKQYARDKEYYKTIISLTATCFFISYKFDKYLLVYFIYSLTI